MQSMRHWTLQLVVVEAACSTVQTSLACKVGCGLQGRQLAAGCSLHGQPQAFVQSLKSADSACMTQLRTKRDSHACNPNRWPVC